MHSTNLFIVRGYAGADAKAAGKAAKVIIATTRVWCDDKKAKVEKHACAGKNSCKGNGGCATDGSKDNKAAAAGVTEKHACKGQNSCKGNGGCATDGKAHKS